MFTDWCFGIHLRTHSRVCFGATPTTDMHVSFVQGLGKNPALLRRVL